MAIRKVIGLSYEPQKGKLPAVVLKATGGQADYIENQFRNQKPDHRIIEDKDLTNKLFRLPTDSEISPDLYALVAILLVHVYSVEAKLKEVLNHD